MQDCGTVIPSIADVLLNQFNAEAAVHWQAAYGTFCSQHTQVKKNVEKIIKDSNFDRNLSSECKNLGDSSETDLIAILAYNSFFFNIYPDENNDPLFPFSQDNHLIWMPHDYLLVDDASL